jgi:hypothetical protein
MAGVPFFSVFSAPLRLNDYGLQMTDDGWGLLESTNYEVRSTVRAGVLWMAGVPELFVFSETLR